MARNTNRRGGNLQRDNGLRRSSAAPWKVYLFETPARFAALWRPVKRFGFRTRLFLILALFATVPAVILTTAWGGAVAELLPLMAGQAAWESASSTGERALDVARQVAQRQPFDLARPARTVRARVDARPDRKSVV